MKPGEGSPSVVYEAFDETSHLSGVVGILGSLEWDNFGYDPDLTRKSLTAPGVTTIIAVARDTGEVVGFAQVFGDGVFQAHLGLLAVDEKWRCRGVGRGLVEEAFARVGAGRMDLTSSDEGLDFYRTLKHREQVGFRIYPDPDKD
ncbi:MAG: GNAT family N-acetyltransferase [Actinomycetota bacterium]|nr:GNAT family N-acetyltransferase [Actinomycetota bacterium]